ncbi:MAG TPA: ABC transporter permease subunit [Acidimicrobiia bacterium]|nr:ABC transporter permease subunit [Acidimicrobiia bacterium]
MTWLTWRQLRLQALTLGLLAAAIVVVAAVTGPNLADAVTGNSSPYDQLTSTDRTLFTAGIVVLAVLPALLGAFWGGPMVARELEAGTHQLAWTQSVTRRRWLATKLGLTTAIAALVVGVTSLAITWWSSSIDGAVSSASGALPERLTPVSFAMRGLTPLGYAVFAVALGALVGAIVRRTTLAMAITLAVFIAIQIAVPIWVRPNLIPPTIETIAFSQKTFAGITIRGDQLLIELHTPNRSDWVIANETIDTDGDPATVPEWFRDCLPGVDGGNTAPTRVGNEDPLWDCLTQLTDAGYRQRLVYQSADRFWRLQWAETSTYLIVSALLALASYWWIRHRLA